MSLFRGLFAALIGAQMVYTRVPAPRLPAATRAIVLLRLATSGANPRSLRRDPFFRSVSEKFSGR